MSRRKKPIQICVSILPSETVQQSITRVFSYIAKNAGSRTDLIFLHSIPLPQYFTLKCQLLGLLITAQQALIVKHHLTTEFAPCCDQRDEPECKMRSDDLCRFLLRPTNTSSHHGLPSKLRSCDHVAPQHGFHGNSALQLVINSPLLQVNSIAKLTYRENTDRGRVIYHIPEEL